MDGKGRCIDNVFVERLWRSLKYEEVYLHAYGRRGTARDLPVHDVLQREASPPGPRLPDSGRVLLRPDSQGGVSLRCILTKSRDTIVKTCYKREEEQAPLTPTRFWSEEWGPLQSARWLIRIDRFGRRPLQFSYTPTFDLAIHRTLCGVKGKRNWRPARLKSLESTDLSSRLCGASWKASAGMPCPDGSFAHTTPR
jgi:hypothetical protein